MSLSLPLSKEAQDSGSRRESLSVELCLRHFIAPENLPGIHCPTCNEKTVTSKQHVVAKLPKVLCLHLKRFDSSYNKKIEDFVSFPIKGLDMGPYLPHW
jgi:ubiquitin C-terminal hydrolase